MLFSTINAITKYQHDLREVEELARAVAPMRTHMKASIGWQRREVIDQILKGEEFRYRDAKMMRDSLLKACKHARATMDDYFPMMHQGIMENITTLEDAVKRYWDFFEQAQEEAIPVL
jgi:hypothetical protein